jgi:hypothetical protein
VFHKKHYDLICCQPANSKNYIHAGSEAHRANSTQINTSERVKSIGNVASSELRTSLTLSLSPIADSRTQPLLPPESDAKTTDHKQKLSAGREIESGLQRKSSEVTRSAHSPLSRQWGLMDGTRGLSRQRVTLGRWQEKAKSDAELGKQNTSPAAQPYKDPIIYRGGRGQRCQARCPKDGKLRRPTGSQRQATDSTCKPPHARDFLRDEHTRPRAPEG